MRLFGFRALLGLSVVATSCLLPFNTSITTKQFSHYTVQAGDFNPPNNRLTDAAALSWNNTCTFDPDCRR